MDRHPPQDIKMTGRNIEVVIFATTGEHGQHIARSSTRSTAQVERARTNSKPHLWAVCPSLLDEWDRFCWLYAMKLLTYLSA